MERQILTLLQLWALYRMPFLASVSHQPFLYPLVNRWSIYPGIGRSYTVPIYRLMIKKHAGKGFGYIQYIPAPPYEVGQVHGMNKRGRPHLNWGLNRRFVVLWNNRMGRIPRMDMAFDLQPSVANAQWYSTYGKPYILGGQSTVVLSHMQRVGAYELEVDMEAEPDPEPELEPEPLAITFAFGFTFLSSRFAEQ
ncbi:hypothetical protein J1N35_000207 [Gossypium stocksii]|uniref:Uncharacterized protein n=1 Tax=Gossypium stocksii TaxID=47602 RepID=A0A9D3WGE9_9ROSI|nr:hypothetical protein J1N35_000207 [Gossypium stocksii]